MDSGTKQALEILLVTIGAALVIAAAFGGGVRIAGVEIPKLKRNQRIISAILGTLSLFVSLVLINISAQSPQLPSLPTINNLRVQFITENVHDKRKETLVSVKILNGPQNQNVLAHLEIPDKDFGHNSKYTGSLIPNSGLSLSDLKGATLEICISPPLDEWDFTFTLSGDGIGGPGYEFSDNHTVTQLYKDMNPCKLWTLP